MLKTGIFTHHRFCFKQAPKEGEAKLNKMDLIHWDTARRADALHNEETASNYNKTEKAHTLEETRNPVKNIYTGIKRLVQSTLGFAADVVTNPIAMAANIGRYAMDVTTRLPARALLLGTDWLSRNTFGRISSIMQSINNKLHATIGDTANGPAAKGHGGGRGHTSDPHASLADFYAPHAVGAHH